MRNPHDSEYACGYHALIGSTRRHCCAFCWRCDPDRAAGCAAARWPTASGRRTPPTLASTHYSPLAQIDGSNFKSLEVAWRFKTDSLGPRPEFKLEGTPLMVKACSTRRPARGARSWRSTRRRRADVGAQRARGPAQCAPRPRQLSGRGVAYWTDGRDERILYVTIGFRLVELDAKTGRDRHLVRQERRRRSESGAVFGIASQSI
jgi:quinoprotein glucose dehydrogenase